MWEQSLFDTLYKVLNEGGILTTYCAKGVVRRMLQTAGFTVERLPGLRGENARYCGQPSLIKLLGPKLMNGQVSPKTVKPL